MTKKRNPNRISELRLGKKWNQSELAEAVGAHWVTISKLERGQMRLTQEWMERIGSVLGVKPEELIADHSSYRTIYLHGFVDDAGSVTKQLTGNGDNIPLMTTAPFSVQFGAPRPDSTVWYLVVTENYYPFIRSGDVIRFTYQEQICLDSAAGRLCLIETSEPDPRTIVGVPSRGCADGLVDIYIQGKAPLKDIPIKELAVISLAIFVPDMLVDEDGYPVDIWDPEFIVEGEPYPRT